jgi:hypothetical protein
MKWRGELIVTDQNPDRLKIKHEQKLAWDDRAEGWKRWWILEWALASAGFRDVSIERLDVTFEFASADQCADFRSSIGGTRATFATHPDEVRRKVREAMVSSARAHAGPDGVVRLRNETICFAARS